ncbi:MAG: acyltransferase [Prosthecobacter sp.]|uniref:acyltransferase family protein n=1 Tax=Prosthecobacter sp. TaxID=1965333 RepID=UPI0025F25669|nr:acyltransferase [Prosthecobacter sp.]MCF7787350.1 acyltransferase [Prosthecobacter sp.]
MSRVKLSIPSSPQKRLKSLDLLRLLLCLLVMATHARRVFDIDIPVWLTKGLFDGKGGVVLFFVLSGYVLTKSLARSSISWDNYKNYIIKRALRLFPLYWVGVLFAFVVLVWIKQGGAGLVDDEHLQFLRANGPTWPQWLLHLFLLIPGMNSDFALPTVWSLMTEAKVSMLAFPFFGWAILRFPVWGAVTMVAFCVFGSDYLYHHVFGTAAILGIFGLGAVLARVPEHWWNRIPGAAWWTLLLTGGTFYSCMSLRYLFPSVWIGYCLCAFGAVLIIACVSHWPALSRPMHALYSVFDVDLSYGIYLLHYPMLLVFFKISAAYSSLPSVPVALLAMAATIALAWFFVHAVEIPMIKLGRRVTRRQEEGAQNSSASCPPSP